MKPNIIPSVFTAVDKVSAVMAKMEKSVGNFAAKADAAIARTERNFRKFSNQAQNVGRNAAIFGAAVLAPMAVAANSAMEFEASMSNVATLIDTNVESMDKMGGEILKMARHLPAPIEELTASLYDIRSAGVSAENAMKVLDASGRLAAAGLATTSESTNMMTSAINAFKNEGLKAAEISDILFKTVKFGKTNISQLAQAFGATAPIVQSAGVLLADFSAATAALTTVGTPAAQAQNQIRASIIALQKPTADMEKIFKKLGVATGEELIKREGNLVNAFKAVNNEGGKMNMNLAKAWSSTEALAAVTSLLGSTNEAYVTTLQDMTKGTNAIDEAFAKQSSTMKAQAQIAKNEIQVLSITIGQQLLPIISDVLKSVMPVIERFSSWAMANKETVGTIVKVVAAAGGLALVISGIAFALAAFTKVIYIAKFAMGVYNIAMGVMGAVTGVANIAIGKSTLALYAYKIALMAASPAGLLTIGVIALTAAIYASTSAITQESVALKVNADIKQKVLEKTVDQKLEIDKLFRTLLNAQKGTDDYNKALGRLEEIQPGITKKHELETASVKQLSAAYRELIMNIEKQAEVQAAQELYAESVKERQRLELDAKSKAGQGVVEQFFRGFYEYDDTLDRVKERLEAAKLRENELKNRVIANESANLPQVNTTQTINDVQTGMMTNTNNASLNLNINDPNGRVEPIKNTPSFVTVKTTSTR